MNCIDVSSNQGKISWQEVAVAGVTHTIIRTILKNKTPDGKAVENFISAQSAGITTDAYKYSYALSEAESRKEGELTAAFLNTISFPHKIEFVWWDMEWSTQRQKLTRQKITDLVKVAAEVVQLAGYNFGCYCNLDWYKNVLYPEQLPYDFWIARYPENDDGTIHENLRPGVGEKIWQYSSKGRIAGIDKWVDLNDY